MAAQMVYTTIIEPPGSSLCVWPMVVVLLLWFRDRLDPWMGLAGHLERARGI